MRDHISTGGLDSYRGAIIDGAHARPISVLRIHAQYFFQACYSLCRACISAQVSVYATFLTALPCCGIIRYQISDALSEESRETQSVESLRRQLQVLVI